MCHNLPSHTLLLVGSVLRFCLALDDRLKWDSDKLTADSRHQTFNICQNCLSSGLRWSLPSKYTWHLYMWWNRVSDANIGLKFIANLYYYFSIHFHCLSQFRSILLSMIGSLSPQRNSVSFFLSFSVLTLFTCLWALLWGFVTRMFKLIWWLNLRISFSTFKKPEINFFN